MNPLPLYAQRREVLGAWLADMVKTGDEPSVVAKAPSPGNGRTTEAAAPGRGPWRAV